ncbi:hypothetical protein H5410_021751, partial [Solanum commersonii]
SILLLLVLGFPRLKKKPGACRPNHRSDTRCSLSPGQDAKYYNALVVQGRDSVDQPINMACEVHQLLGNSRVRVVAISATDGLPRGMAVIDTGAPITHGGVSIFGGVGECTREGNDLYMEMKSGVINKENIAESKVALVYGQMNEPPGARMRVGFEVSALLGRMPFVVGYQSTLSTEMGSLQERITSTKDGSITSIQAVYVPADDLTDPRPRYLHLHI